MLKYDRYATNSWVVAAVSLTVALHEVPDPQTWTTVTKSSVQKKTAYDDTDAPFTRLQVAYDLEAMDPSHMDANLVFRTLVTIKWYRPDGSVEGTVRLLPTYYFNNDPLNQQTFHDWCQGVSTTG